MLMKKALLLNVSLAVLALAPLCCAQNEEPPSLDSAIALVRAGIQANKTSIVGQLMNLNDQEAAAFWPIYRSIRIRKVQAGR